MTNDKPELSSDELLRQSPEALGLPSDLGPPPAPEGLVTPPSPDAGTVRGGTALPGSAIPEPPKAWLPAPTPLPPSASTTPAPAPPSTEYYPAAPFRPESYGAPSSPAPPNASSATPPAAMPPPPERGTSGTEYYPTEPVGPQSYGVDRPPPPASSLGTPAPPASLGMWQKGTPLPAPPKRKQNIPWGWVIGIGIALVVGLVGWVVGSDTTSANRIGVGDCFENPGFGDFTTVTDQECDALHDIQTFARLKNVPANLIADSDDPDGAGYQCETELLELLAADHMQDPAIVIPDDATMGWLSDPDTSSRGDVLCTIESPSGSLVGSVVP